jgi:hypothetical protein
LPAKPCWISRSISFDISESLVICGMVRKIKVLGVPEVGDLGLLRS